MRLYVAGPMTGIKDYNYPAFSAAVEQLAQRGYEPINPACRGFVKGWTWLDYMRWSLHDVAFSQGIATLPGWRDSRGASLEVHVARRIGLPVRPVHEWEQLR